jgi:hypothetical protein
MASYISSHLPMRAVSPAHHISNYVLWRVRAKLSLCLTNYTLRHEGVWRTWCIDPHSLDLGISWRWVVSFTPRPLYPRGKSPRYPSDRRSDGPQSRSGRCGEEKILGFTGTRNVILGRPAHSHTDYSIAAPVVNSIDYITRHYAVICELSELQWFGADLQIFSAEITQNIRDKETCILLVPVDCWLCFHV